MPRWQESPVLKFPDGGGLSFSLIKQVKIVEKGVLLLARPDEVLAIIECDAATAKVYNEAIVAALQLYARGRTLPPMPWEV